MLKIKGNQKKLKNIIATIEADQAIPATTTHEESENSRGRKNTWEISTYDCEDAQLQAKWRGLKRFIVVLKTVFFGDKKTQEKHYYITSTTTATAQALARGIRGHWGIENKLHRTRDVHFRQDMNKIKDPTASVNVSIFNTIAINHLVQHIHTSIDFAQMIFCQNFKTKLDKLRT